MMKTFQQLQQISIAPQISEQQLLEFGQLFENLSDAWEKHIIQAIQEGRSDMLLYQCSPRNTQLCNYFQQRLLELGYCVTRQYDTQLKTITLILDLKAKK